MVSSLGSGVCVSVFERGCVCILWTVETCVCN